MLQIELTEERTFTARAGERFTHGLRLVGEWEGLRKLQRQDGAVLIVDGNTVVKASPALIAELMIAANGDCFVTVPATKLPDGSTVPEFRVGQFLTGRDSHGRLAITPEAEPWVRISYHDARKAAAAAGYALITERQWLAIALNVFGVKENWYRSGAGELCLRQGICNGHVSAAQAGTYTCADDSEQRWLTLSNGQPICDINGNAYSWVFDDVQGDAAGLVRGRIEADSLSLKTAPFPSGEKGMGYRPDGARDWSGYALFRGGYWGSDSSAGVFRLSGDWPDYARVYVGFRCTKPGP